MRKGTFIVMKCPSCGYIDTKVVDSRPAENNTTIRRRRVCLECGTKFSTYEHIETMPVMVIKKDKTREVFDRAKLLGGVLKACHKRPVTSAQVENIVRDIENTIKNSPKNEIPSVVIGTMVMERLKDIDEIAYVRFASVYREFKDVDTFLKELNDIKNHQKVKDEE